MTHNDRRQERRFCAVAVVLLVTVQVGAFSAEQTASGIVFNDQNRNGIRDGGERGVKNVAVSNGRDVVLTNRHGEYVSTPV